MDYTELYYKCERPELLRYIEPGENRILDVGCAEGVFGKSLKQRGLAGEVVGIEIFLGAAEIAEKRLDRVICGDIETMNRNNPELEPQSFDYIVCGDVLEHLRDPWSVLGWMVTLLKKDGAVIASFPNIRHWSVILPLLFMGTWSYQKYGIMDRTHLRFFTRKSAISMFLESGLNVELCEGSKLQGKKDKLMNLLLLGMGKEFVSGQWTLVGKRQKTFT